jgi:hypothetical protein
MSMQLGFMEFFFFNLWKLVFATCLQMNNVT